MKVSGFTFLKNGSVLGYPFVESIKSALPICDEFIIALGQCDDDTEEKILAIGDPKIRIIHTTWNEKMQDRGYVYGQQKMIAHFNCSGDWALYIEGDEVLHEDELDTIRGNMERFLDDKEVEAFYFDFYHFYGRPDQVGISGYRRAPRIIRNSLRSIAPDGLFFVVLDKNKKGRYPKAVHAGGNVYHYGHVRNVENMQEKINQVSKYWDHKPEPFPGYGDIDTAVIRPFKGTHPAIMKEWLEKDAEWDFAQNPDYKLSKRDKKVRLKLKVEDALNIEISKKHYTDLKKSENKHKP
ncbi:glycosyltransferase [Amphritea sp. HPY]|uniref:glycosyltransferase n=1 Tax=Amphritea sp. HPY TaxID=3421652 RepID=UPI003D7D2301